MNAHSTHLTRGVIVETKCQKQKKTSSVTSVISQVTKPVPSQYAR